MGSNATKKRVHPNCFLKAFILEDGTRTTSYHRANQELSDGHEVRMFVHVKGYGHWKTSRVVQISSAGLSKKVETQGRVYKMIGIEPPVRIKSAAFTVAGSSVQLSTDKPGDCYKLKELIKAGSSLKAVVYMKDGSPHLTSEIIEFNKNEMVTENCTVYRW